jgi:hypothetical protein
MVIEPGLQVARLCEIKQVLRQLLQLPRWQNTKPLTAAGVETAE